MFRFPPLTPLCKWLLIVLCVAYVTLVIAVNWLGAGWLMEALLLSPTLGVHTLWQPITFPLVQPTGPDGMLSFFVSLVFFWWVVAPFEQSFGTRHTVRLLALTSLAAAAAVVLVGTLLSLASDPSSPFLSSGPLFGVSAHWLAAMSAFAWSMRFKGPLNLFGVLPLKATTLIYLLLGWSLLHFLTSRDMTNLVADLAAVGTGIFYIEVLSRPPNKAAPRKPRKSGASLRLVEGGKRDDDPPKWLN